MTVWQRVKENAVARWSLAIAGYASTTAIAVVVLATSADRLIETWFKPVATPVPAEAQRASATKSRQPVLVRTASMIPTNDEWATRLLDPSYWKRANSSANKPSSWSTPAQPKWNLGAQTPPLTANGIIPRSNSKVFESKDDDNDGDTYRTMCVRLCDGAFFPLSFSTTRERFEADASRCEKTCSGSRMFIYKNPGESPEDMEDLKGQPYKNLSTAFLFRTKYDASCKCRAHPWEETSRNQHRVYALEAQKATGNKVAFAELAELKAQMAKAERDAMAEKKRAEVEKVAAQKLLADEAKAAKAKARQLAKTERNTVQTAKISDQNTYGAQFKASAALPSKALLKPSQKLSKPLFAQSNLPMSVPRTAAFTPVPDIRQSRMGLGTR